MQLLQADMEKWSSKGGVGPESGREGGSERETAAWEGVTHPMTSRGCADVEMSETYLQKGNEGRGETGTGTEAEAEAEAERCEARGGKYVGPVQGDGRKSCRMRRLRALGPEGTWSRYYVRSGRSRSATYWSSASSASGILQRRGSGRGVEARPAATKYFRLMAHARAVTTPDARQLERWKSSRARRPPTPAHPHPRHLEAAHHAARLHSPRQSSGQAIGPPRRPAMAPRAALLRRRQESWRHGHAQSCAPRHAVHLARRPHAD